MAAVAEPFRFLKYSEQNYIAEFAANSSIQSPIGTVEIDYFQFDKLLSKYRTQHFGLIRPTLQNPLVVVRLPTGRVHFIKTFIDREDGVIYFVSIAQDERGWYDVRTNHKRNYNQILRTLQEGDIIYQNSSHTALDDAEPPPPTYAASRFRLPFRLDTKIVKSENPMKQPTLFDGLEGIELIDFQSKLNPQMTIMALAKAKGVKIYEINMLTSEIQKGTRRFLKIHSKSGNMGRLTTFRY
jgi:hypothetical protein